MSETKILEEQKIYKQKVSKLAEEAENSVNKGEFENKKIAVNRISEWAVEEEIVTESEIVSYSQSDTVEMTCYDDNMSSDRLKQYIPIETLRKDISRNLDILW